MQIAISSSPPCGATKASSKGRIPLAWYSPITAPIDTPFASSTVTVSTPAVIPEAKASIATFTLLVMIDDAITGRNSSGSGM